MATKNTLPCRADLARIAENSPGFLNLLLAYFVFEWQEVRMGSPAHGIDQTGLACHVPDYVGMWTDAETDGVSAALHYLLRSPQKRAQGEPGFVSLWLAENSG